MNKTSVNHLQIHKFVFKTVIFTTRKFEMYLKILQKLSCPGCIFSKQAKPRREENKVKFFEGQFRTAKLSFVHKKKSEHSFELSCSFNGEFKSWTTRNFGLGEEVCYRTVLWRQRPSWAKSITCRTKLIICFICKACREACYILLFDSLRSCTGYGNMS